MKWPCPDCRASYSIEKPDPRVEPLMCEYRHADGKLCGRRYYCALTKNSARFMMWPHPEPAETGSTEQDLMQAVKLMRDLWDKPAGVHASKLYTSVADVCRIYSEIEDKT